MERLDFQEMTECQDLRDPLDTTAQLDLQVMMAQLDPPDFPGPLDNLVLLDTMVLLERPGRGVQSPRHEKMRDVALVQLG